MGASCCIVGETRSSTLEKHAEWLSGWFKHALNRMKTASELALAIRATSTSNSQVIIANEICKQLDNDFLRKDGDGEKPLIDSIMEVDEKLRKGEIPQDFFTFKHIIGNVKYKKYFRLTLVPREFAESENDEDGETPNNILDKYSRWLNNYLISLDERCHDGTIANGYEDTIYLPRELIPPSADANGLSINQKQTVDRLKVLSRTANVRLRIIIDSSGSGFIIDEHIEIPKQ